MCFGSLIGYFILVITFFMPMYSSLKWGFLWNDKGLDTIVIFQFRFKFFNLPFST